MCAACPKPSERCRTNSCPSNSPGANPAPRPDRRISPIWSDGDRHQLAPRSLRHVPAAPIPRRCHCLCSHPAAPPERQIKNLFVSLHIASRERRIEPIRKFRSDLIVRERLPRDEHNVPSEAAEIRTPTNAQSARVSHPQQLLSDRLSDAPSYRGRERPRCG